MTDMYNMVCDVGKEGFVSLINYTEGMEVRGNKNIGKYIPGKITKQLMNAYKRLI